MYFPAPGPGPQFVFTGPAPNLYLPALAPNLCLQALAPNFYLTVLARICVYLICYSSVQVKILLLLPQLLVLSLPLASPTTTTATTTTTNTSTTRDNNKRCLHGSKIHLKWPLLYEKAKSCFTKFVSVMANVSLNREAAAVKKIGG